MYCTDMNEMKAFTVCRSPVHRILFSRLTLFGFDNRHTTTHTMNIHTHAHKQTQTR